MKSFFFLPCGVGPGTRGRSFVVVHSAGFDVSVVSFSSGQRAVPAVCDPARGK